MAFSEFLFLCISASLRENPSNSSAYSMIHNQITEIVVDCTIAFHTNLESPQSSQLGKKSRAETQKRRDF